MGRVFFMPHIVVKWGGMDMEIERPCIRSVFFEWPTSSWYEDNTTEKKKTTPARMNVAYFGNFAQGLRLAMHNYGTGTAYFIPKLA
jgi:hypothetical protein